MFNESKRHIIDQHLAGNLLDRKQFEELINNDPTFKDQVEKTQIANQAIHQLGLISVGDKLDQIHENTTKTNKRIRNWTLGTGLLLGGLIIGYFSSTNEPTTVTMQDEEPSTKSIEVANTEVIIDPIQAQNIQEKIVTPTPTPTLDTPIFTERSTAPTPDQEDVIIALVEVPKKDTILPEPVKNDQNENYTKKDESKITCPTISLTKSKTTPSCIGQDNGKFEFDQTNISGGTAPYRFQFLDPYQNEVNEDFLSKGSYQLDVTDDNNCMTTVSHFDITEIRCTQKLDVRLSPNYSETWEYPIIEGIEEYTVYIRDRSGEVIFKKLINTDFESNWNGTIDDGSTIKQGLYFLEVKTNSEELFIGTVTIVQ